MSRKALVRRLTDIGTSAQIPVSLWAVPSISLVGALIGCVDALGIVALGLPPIVITLAMKGILQGLMSASATGWVCAGRLWNRSKQLTSTRLSASPITSRYEGLYQNLWQPQQHIVHCAGPLSARIEAERRKKLTTDKLGDRATWRDRRLMALIAHKRDALKGE